MDFFAAATDAPPLDGTDWLFLLTATMVAWFAFGGLDRGSAALARTMKNAVPGATVTATTAATTAVLAAPTPTKTITVGAEASPFLPPILAFILWSSLAVAIIIGVTVAYLALETDAVLVIFNPSDKKHTEDIRAIARDPSYLDGAVRSALTGPAEELRLAKEELRLAREEIDNLQQQIPIDPSDSSHPFPGQSYKTRRNAQKREKKKIAAALAAGTAAAEHAVSPGQASS